MLESRASYGYYGCGHGATGEEQPKVHASGWHFMNYHFEVLFPNWRNSQCVEIKASSYENALKQLKKWAKRDHFEIIGDKKGCENQRTW